MTGLRRLRGFGVGLIALAFLLEFRRQNTQQDDAYISYRYAFNLVTGHGLVFNVGERVEGFTNLLWTLLVAAGMETGVSAPAMGHWLSEAFGAASLILTYKLARALLPDRLAWRAVLAPLVLYASNAFASWMTSGLETPLVVALAVAVAWLSVQRAEWWVAVLCSLAMLTRPDGVLLAAVFVSLGAWRRWSASGRLPADAPMAAAPAMLFAASLVLVEAWRWSYYGDLLPNTFYAKVGGIPGVQGWAYLYTFLRDGPFLLLPGIAVAIWRLPAFRPLAGFALLTAAYVVAIGGDAFAFWRFLLPVLPLMIAGAVAGSAVLMAGSPRPGWACVSALPICIVWSLYVVWPSQGGLLGREYARLSPAPFPISSKRSAATQHLLFGDDDDLFRNMVAKLRALSPPVRLVACVGIGKLSYFAPDLEILDIVGLVDKHVAHSQRRLAGANLLPGHQRTDSDYILSRRPDVIQIPRKGSSDWRLPSMLDLWQNPDLDRLYIYNTTLNAYVLRH